MPNDDFLRYFIKHTDDRFDDLEKKVDRLIGFRWMLIGAASVVSVVVSFGWEIAKTMAGK